MSVQNKNTVQYNDIAIIRSTATESYLLRSLFSFYTYVNERVSIV